MTWIKWMHWIMGTSLNTPREKIPADEHRRAIVEQKLEVRREKRELDELEEIVTVAERRLQTQADVMGRKEER